MLSEPVQPGKMKYSLGINSSRLTLADCAVDESEIKNDLD